MEPPQHPRFQIDLLTFKEPLTKAVEASPVALEQWRLNLWEACCLSGDVESLIAETPEEPREIQVPPGSP